MESKDQVEEVVERMKRLISVKSDAQLSLYFGSSRTLISNKKSRGSIPFEECLILCEQKGVSLDWLIRGAGDAPDMDAEDAPVSSTLIQIPLYDIEAAAGDGTFSNQELINAYLPFSTRWLADQGVHAKNVVALRTVGDSMADTVNEGDVILVDRSRTKPDGVFLVRVGDALRIKRVQRMAGGALSLVSDNRKYEPELITPEMLGREEVEVIGQVFGHLGRVV